jgi:chromosome segregation ATPase
MAEEIRRAVYEDFEATLKLASQRMLEHLNTKVLETVQKAAKTLSQLEKAFEVSVEKSVIQFIGPHMQTIEDKFKRDLEEEINKSLESFSQQLKKQNQITDANFSSLKSGELELQSSIAKIDEEIRRQDQVHAAMEEQFTIMTKSLSKQVFEYATSLKLIEASSNDKIKRSFNEKTITDKISMAEQRKKEIAEELKGITATISVIDGKIAKARILIKELNDVIQRSKGTELDKYREQMQNVLQSVSGLISERDSLLSEYQKRKEAFRKYLTIQETNSQLFEVLQTDKNYTQQRIGQVPLI